MVNVTYTESSSDMIYTADDGTQYLYNLGDMSFVIVAMALVWIMVPGVGLFYSGLLRRKNALSMIFLSMAGVAVGSFQWFFWGYSLTFSDTGSKYIGDLRYFGLKGVLAQPSAGSDRIPALVFCIYQCMFCVITGVIAIGGFAERSRIGPVMVFLFCWLTLVYCPLACWTWNPNGWSFIMGGLDFAGGTPVHISSGTASLAIALYLGKRRGYGTERLAYKPHNTAFVVIGTVFLWFGWFGFNGGSALSANLRAVQACIVTNLSASIGGLTWMFLDYRLERKWSAVGFCSGAISGLVGITPAAGFVGSPAAVAIGAITAIACNFATKLKFLIRVDETLDVFASHGIGGMVGCFLTGLFAQGSVAGFDGITDIPGGWVSHNWIQAGYQMADLTAGFAYTFVMTTIICWLLHFIPGLRLRASEEAEIIGIDDAYLGEFAYDYVGTDPELRLHRIDSKPQLSSGDVVIADIATSNGRESSTTEKVDPHATTGDAAPGGGRVDV
ncbi:amt family ammonium transporter [Cryptococcus gattii Ru294]|uniref:Ammonium transporter n=2 Tax=Cryptococcus gattii TaxID=37769 RepID=E6RC55_CRYGW|nr:ammonium transporter, putative [Cryptococcus gattii WM276]ADV24372.1 ammonium transporter, putative [Cryptococcus gattii WM276]KIR54535.1 amt family ammonium transporter [Cryptococcus gattii Ru294]KIY32489.1 amt family ammonium transporter [Cryptococcus gattii E566]KJE02595.1 amt family ammonium transporter [Cryptococcus gattii NT-10]